MPRADEPRYVGIFLTAKTKIRLVRASASGNTMCARLSRFAPSCSLTHQLDVALAVDQDIGRLYVPVNPSPRMYVGDCLRKLRAPYHFLCVGNTDVPFQLLDHNAAYRSAFCQPEHNRRHCLGSGVSSDTPAQEFDHMPTEWTKEV